MSNVLSRLRRDPDARFLADAHELERYTREQVKREDVIPKRDRLGIGADLTRSARYINECVRKANGIYIRRDKSEDIERLRERISLQENALLELQNFLELVRLVDDAHGRKIKDPSVEQWTVKVMALWASLKAWRDSEKKLLRQWL